MLTWAALPTLFLCKTTEPILASSCLGKYSVLSKEVMIVVAVIFRIQFCEVGFQFQMNFIFLGITLRMETLLLICPVCCLTGFLAKLLKAFVESLSDLNMI